MAIEPLGSIMSIQSQGMVQTKPIPTKENKSQVSSATVSNVESIDKTVSVVEDARSKGNTNSGENWNLQTQNSEQKNDGIRKAVEKLNKNMPQSEAVFGIHESTKRVMIKIVDKETKELIREDPAEETLDMIAKAWELAGILVDEKR